MVLRLQLRLFIAVVSNVSSRDHIDNVVRRLLNMIDRRNVVGFSLRTTPQRMTRQLMTQQPTRLLAPMPAAAPCVATARTSRRPRVQTGAAGAAASSTANFIAHGILAIDEALCSPS